MSENQGSKGRQEQGQHQQGQGRGRGGRGGRGRDRRGGGPKPSNDANHQERQRLFSECSEDHCAVCLNRLVVYAVGRCNHPVCSECSTRMRVLCAQNECPICRQDLPKVFHTNLKQRYEEIENNVYLMDRKFGICFETEAVQQLFVRLLEHRCPVCDKHELKGKEKNDKDKENSDYPEDGSKPKPAPGRNKFLNFRQLDKHMRVEHDLYYCDLCTGHLKSFTHERRLYNRSELATHRRKGDADNTSHRGHPVCQFCEQRFVDNDELFRHLRKDHFFCHFCDADGSHLYFPDYNRMKIHFRDEHYLCEEGNCINEQFTSAFRSEIDLKAHRIDRHSGGLSKAATKQNRTVDVELNYSRPVSNNQVGRRRGMEGDSHDQFDGGQLRSSASDGRLPDMAADFPSLEMSAQPSAASSGGAGSGNLARRVASSSGLSWSSGSKAGAAFQDQDFPSLPGAPKGGGAQPRTQPQFRPPPKPVPKPVVKREPDFPSLSSESRSRGAGNILSNFREVESQPLYRNLPGHSGPVWQSSSQGATASSNIQVVEKKPEPTNSMVQLTKRKEAPSPFAEEFPGLGPSQRPSSSSNARPDSSAKKSDSASSSANSKKKNKGNKNGFLIGDDVLPSAEQSSSKDQGGRLKGASNLQTAADLIFMEKKTKAAPALNGSKNKKTNNGPNEKSDAKASTSKNNDDKKTETEVDHKAENKKETKVVDQVKEEPRFQLVRPSKNNAPAAAIETPSKPVPKPALTATEQFPSLGASTSKISANFVPVKSASNQSVSTWNGKAPVAVQTVQPSTRGAPPPGFQNPAPVKKPAPPPGFKAPVMLYQEPSNFAPRNQQLLSTIMSLIGGKSVEFDRFKTLSSRFRSGGCSSSDYHSECLNLIEKKTFEKFFPQLIALLPDIKKQKELYDLHKKKYPGTHLPLANCDTCGQVLLLTDVNEHETFHELDQDFPMLSMR